MSMKFYNLDDKAQKEEYMKSGGNMKKRRYNDMYNNPAPEAEKNLQNESTPVEEETKSTDSVKEEKNTSMPVSPDTKGEIIKVENLRLRKEPSENAEVLDLIPKTVVLDIIGRVNNDWFEVNAFILGSNKHGYVMSKFVRDFVEAKTDNFTGEDYDR